ncbi:MAG: ribosomal protein S18-alanine N-acetyltransferase [Pseudomonadales bacterium]|nr:ribosomal protein S18-alanine N-acetyltransferase [Pseudomonadales bacterium]
MAISENRDQFSIREMGPDDLEQVGSIEQVASAHPWRRSLFQSCFDGGYHCFVGCVDSVVVGFGILSVAAKEAHLQNIAVSPDWQGAGYGRDLLGALIDLANELSARVIFLEVSVENSVALSLYLSKGFREIGIRKNYYTTADGKKDARIMRLNLAKTSGFEMITEMIRRSD